MTGGSVWREVSEGRIRAPADRVPWPASGPTATEMDTQIEAAVDRIADRCEMTPVRAFSLNGTRCVAKLESLQRTGSFKIRGAANRMLTLSEHERGTGVVTASSGNHGVAVARLARELGLHAVVCVPRDADPVKLEAIRAAGAEVRADAADYDASERQARALAEQRGLCLVHPFDDLAVIAGHATLGRELAAQVPDGAAVLIPLSGGGLAAGVACALRTAGARTRLIGVSPSHAPVMYRSLLAGSPVAVNERPTLAGALSGGLGDRNRHSFALVSALLDEVWLIDEAEIAAAMGWGAEALDVAVEGAGAAALAALTHAAAGTFARDGPLVAVVSGGNVDPGTVQRARRTAAGSPPPDITPEADPLHL